MWNVRSFGDDEVHRKIDKLEDCHFYDEFKGGAVHWYTAYVVTRTVFLILGPLIILAVVIYIVQNEIIYDTTGELVSMVVTITIVFVISFFVSFGIFYIRLFHMHLYKIGNRDKVFVDPKGLSIHYNILDGWFSSRAMITDIPFDNIENIMPLKHDTIKMTKYWFMKMITMSIWKPKGSIHTPFTPLRDIIIIELYFPMEMVAYGRGSLKKGQGKKFTGERIFIQIRKKDQERFFELLGIDI